MDSNYNTPDPTPENKIKEAENLIHDKLKKEILRIEHIPQIIKSHPWHEPVNTTLYWRDPVKSGLTFAIGNLFFFLMTYGEYSLLTLTTTVFLFFLLAVGGYVKFKRDHSEHPNHSQYDNSNSREHMKEHVETLVKIVESVRGSLTDYLYFVDFAQSAKVALIALALRTLGTILSDLTLLYFVFFGCIYLASSLRGEKEGNRYWYKNSNRSSPPKIGTSIAEIT